MVIPYRIDPGIKEFTAHIRHILNAAEERIILKFGQDDAVPVHNRFLNIPTRTIVLNGLLCLYRRRKLGGQYRRIRVI